MHIALKYKHYCMHVYEYCRLCEVKNWKNAVCIFTLKIEKKLYACDILNINNVHACEFKTIRYACELKNIKKTVCILP